MGVFEIILIAFGVLIGIGAIWAFLFSRRVKKDGIDAQATVSRIEVSESLDADGTVSRTETVWITYRNLNGETVEAMLSNPKKGLQESSRILIRYLPERQDYPVLVKVL